MFASGKAASASAANYIEEVFNTYLYTGSASNQTFTNGIDMLGKGGIVVVKNRANNTVPMYWCSQDGKILDSSSTGGASGPNIYPGNNSIGFNSNGISIASGGAFSNSGDAHVAWSFRKQPKFFDVVTYTGNGTAGRTISHSLGSTPGMMIVKCTSTTGQWAVYHRSLGGTLRLYLDSTGASGADSGIWNNTDPTSTVFTVGSGSQVNASTRTYQALLFAHDAGGFGLTGADNVISCGSYTGNGSATGPIVTLGYEPQWVLLKNTTTASGWFLIDNMRGIATGSSDQYLLPNATDAEASTAFISLNATGFSVDSTGFINTSGNTIIYIAIRRGPMKVPTSGTSVFSPQLIGAATGTNVTTGFPIDLQIYKNRDGGSNYTVDRLRGVSTSSTAINYPYLITEATSAEVSTSTRTLNWTNTGFQIPSAEDSITNIFWNVRRAPGFFDVVCYTGTGSATTVTHNLGVAPELMIVKRRDSIGAWVVYNPTSGASKILILSTTAADATDTSVWNNSAPTASVFSVGTSNTTNTSAATYVAYLFASCAGVSKVGSYTGNGSSQTINCGFTGGARFVLIKRTNSTGNWYVWDTARGIVAGNDPYLLLNTIGAEVTTDDTIDTDSTGFVVNQVAATNVNVTSATYIFLAIA